MSVMLVGSSIMTTMLIPPRGFEVGGEACGRALAFLAHEHLGERSARSTTSARSRSSGSLARRRWSGCSTWCRSYLPRYGMAPEWARANRPLVFIFTGITFLVTILFNADVERAGRRLRDRRARADGIGGARGHARRPAPRQALAGLSACSSLIFVYTTLVNIVERPDGLKIASWFIVTIIVTSLISRVARSTELRVQSVEPDAVARRFMHEARHGPIRIIANRPDTGLPEEYEHKLREASDSHHLTPDEQVLFLEVRPGDVSEFSGRLHVEGVEIGPHRVLRCVSSAIPNAIAALLLYIRDETGRIPHAYFGWTEGNPIVYL